jgi:hypothetical protein
MTHVTTWTGDSYCMECWNWEGENIRERTAAGAGAHPQDESARGEDAAGKRRASRNDRDKAKLRASYKDHCAYHLFHAHHRKHQGCTFAGAGQSRCSRGSHNIPDDFEDAQGELETPART